MLGIIAIVLISILAAYLAWILWKRLRFCQILSPIPGAKSWPIVGNAMQFDKTPQGKCCWVIPKLIEWRYVQILIDQRSIG